MYEEEGNNDSLFPSPTLFSARHLFTGALLTKVHHSATSSVHIASFLIFPLSSLFLSNGLFSRRILRSHCSTSLCFVFSKRAFEDQRRHIFLSLPLFFSFLLSFHFFWLLCHPHFNITHLYRIFTEQSLYLFPPMSDSVNLFNFPPALYHSTYKPSKQ